MLDTTKILETLPHRYPFLLVDKILEIEPEKYAKGLKNVTINEPFFQGHFPGNPIMPGVLIVEALAQVGACALLSSEKYKGKLILFAGIDNMRFKKRVLPGDTLTLEVSILKIKGSVGKGKATAYVGEDIVAEGELTFAVS
ncbi:MAG: 3-hydroxyacyl-ACP dehydratase FabZ [Thermovenabulum sp.]|uniref:3-hydroxyacyl-ACP dehydratase FabZ n=1 Tax=Thermovenabulum sp. TaxID=3100335 RepID=UPI003C7A7852